MIATTALDIAAFSLSFSDFYACLLCIFCSLFAFFFILACFRLFNLLASKKD